jgi:hypothetical protein
MDTKEELSIIGIVIIAFSLLSFASFQMGKDSMKREAVVAGHALWAYDEIGYPKFHWKDQETVIREYMELVK